MTRKEFNSLKIGDVVMAHNEGNILLEITQAIQYWGYIRYVGKAGQIARTFDIVTPAYLTLISRKPSQERISRLDLIDD